MGYSRSAALKRAAEAREIGRRVRAERRAAREAKSAPFEVVAQELQSSSGAPWVESEPDEVGAAKPKKPRKASTKKTSTKKTTKKS